MIEESRTLCLKAVLLDQILEVSFETDGNWIAIGSVHLFCTGLG